MRTPVKLSVIVPFYNEEDSIEPHARRDRRGRRALADCPSRWCSSTTAAGMARRAGPRRSRAAIRACGFVKFRRNYGQTAAMAAGIEHARGEMLVTMDGDLQNDPADIGSSSRKIDEGYDIVVGWRHDRQDKLDLAQDPLDDRELADRQGHRRADQRQRLLAEGVSRLAHQEHSALFGNAPLHSGDGLDRRDRASPRSRSGTMRGSSAVQVRAVAHLQGAARSDGDQDRRLVHLAAAAVVQVARACRCSLVGMIALGDGLTGGARMSAIMSLPIAGSGVIFLTSAVILMCQRRPR